MFSTILIHYIPLEIEIECQHNKIILIFTTYQMIQNYNEMYYLIINDRINIVDDYFKNIVLLCDINDIYLLDEKLLQSVSKYMNDLIFFSS
ncbi:hypothetical protein [Campylobacter insulaenigrae]|uniref:hypothetical protein n=1 Tax=Campylobacter insulaenigrae TaxID=260714 RepID=UPI0021533DA2|nr:hypothetical protein [Campylobacter insulaenigrae]MCR6570401.1 hypothetical protein [Campylobacter insulaenigrae]MCR6582717.1 hypothetical protein [Campylobacter insulaenigrae]